jgi:hypothetical protein
MFELMMGAKDRLGAEITTDGVAPIHANRYEASSAAIAQSVEHIIRNDGVVGSNPICGTTLASHLKFQATGGGSHPCKVGSGNARAHQRNRPGGKTPGAT